jgi:hypothetical protein
MNDAGQVLEVHHSGSGSLWYWTGQMGSDGTVQWKHHGRYDSGEDPAVAMDADGWIVEVHKSENRDYLWAHVAKMNPDYTVTWGDSQKFDEEGVEPSVAWEQGSQLTEVHRSSKSSQNVRWTAHIDRSNFSLRFEDQETTSQQRFEESASSSAAGSIAVEAASDAEGAGDDTLLYSSGTGHGGRIRYEQLAFVDYQPSNAGELLTGGTLIYNLASGGMEQAQGWLENGWLVRLWGFEQGDVDLAKRQPTCPATDDPHAGWYRIYLMDVGALD